MVSGTEAIPTASKAPGVEPRRAKRLVFCFDGTWNRLDAPTPTNVVLTAESVLPRASDGTAQIIYYDEGVGTGKLERFRGGILGAGLTKNLADAYRHLIFNHEPGDEVFVFGFSRGAYTARSFVGLLRNCGIVSRPQAARVGEAIALYESRSSATAPDAKAIRKLRSTLSPEVCTDAEDDAWRCENVPGYVPGKAAQLNVAYVGVWDTVGALGVPKRYLISNLMNRSTLFHDTDLSAVVRSARHAVAIDETRDDFAPTLWTGLDELNRAAGSDPSADDAPYQQKWFPGDHGSVGGGGDYRGLSDQALDWVWDGARLAGLELDASPASRIFSLQPEIRASLCNIDQAKVSWVAKATNAFWHRSARKNGPTRISDVAISARQRWQAAAESLPEKKLYRPATLSGVAEALSADQASACPPPPVPNTFDVIVVRKNENLTKIAHRLYGDRRFAEAIFAMNRDKLTDVNRIYAGMSLRVPRREDLASLDRQPPGVSH